MFGKMPCFHPWVKKVGRHLPLGPSEKAVLVVGHPFFTGGDGNRSNFKVTIFIFVLHKVRRKPSRSKHMHLLELHEGEF